MNGLDLRLKPAKLGEKFFVFSAQVGVDLGVAESLPQSVGKIREVILLPEGESFFSEICRPDKNFDQGFLGLVKRVSKRLAAKAMGKIRGGLLPKVTDGYLELIKFLSENLVGGKLARSSDLWLLSVLFVEELLESSLLFLEFQQLVFKLQNAVCFFRKKGEIRFRKSFDFAETFGG